MWDVTTGTTKKVSLLNVLLKILGGASSSWAYQTWAPTWANLTIGNATTAYKYIQIGKVVQFNMSVTLGSTSTVGSVPTFTLPVESVALPIPNTPIGNGYIVDIGTDSYPIITLQNTATIGFFSALDSNGTFVSESLITATNPFTWVAGDRIMMNGEYEAA